LGELPKAPMRLAARGRNQPVAMNPSNTYSPERTLTAAVDGVTYRGHWFIDNQVVVMYIGSTGPLSKLILGTSPEIAAQRLFNEFMAHKSIRRGVQRATEPDAQLGETQADRSIGPVTPEADCK